MIVDGVTIARGHRSFRALHAIRPGANWSVSGTVLDWNDPRPPPTQAEIEVAELAACKAEALHMIASACDEVAESITGAIPISERLSWGSKEAAATAYEAGTANEMQTALLQAEASVTGETLSDLVAKVLTNAAAYHAAAGAIAGRRREAAAAIAALSSLATIDADVAAVIAAMKAGIAADLAA